MILVSGTGYWCRIVGNPHKNNFDGPDQWSFDLSVDDENLQKLLDAGMSKDYVRNRTEKNPDDPRGNFISFVRNSQLRDGSPGKPFQIFNAQGKPWGSDLIGNESVLNVVVALNEVKHKGKTKLKPSCIKLQVWDHKKFVGKGDFPTKAEEDTQQHEETEW